MKKLIIALALGAISFQAAAADVKRGAELAKKYNCASCHGADYSKPIDPSYPKLAGQHADYIAHALTAYKRGGDKANGRSNPIMAGMAQPLSDQDMIDIGAYLASLPSQLVVRK
ncbi:cytochrome c [Massilia sp. Dwa41.01b]|uniref:c-type cytochrome n=1 Tax=unclassified Massilia TaxID=2609279 RepID=UPI0015FEDEA0|nr:MULTISPECIES: cytochrome c [unclassified Massilia]QNA90439.1 cytochrome c [Massilia sp. Dwa41.01b]QNA97669.1 cytochrome c [Massilia sp. Se16.2.3]